MIAAFLGAGEIEILAKRVEQRGPGADRQRPLDAVTRKVMARLGGNSTAGSFRGFLLAFRTVSPISRHCGNFERNALEGQRKEKDSGKGQESQDASHDEPGTIVPNEIQHFASSFVLAITRKRWRSSPLGGTA